MLPLSVEEEEDEASSGRDKSVTSAGEFVTVEPTTV